MSVKTVPTKFETSDGREFDTKEDAERHEEVVTAVKGYEDAKHMLGRVLAEREKTADGQPFDFVKWGDYYHVTNGWGGLPGLSRVSFYVWSCEFDVDGRGMVTISKRTQTGRMSDEEKVIRYRIADLYADEGAAQRALLGAQEKWLAEQAERVEELRAKLQTPAR